MIQKIICIYKITSPSGRIYIGQTIDFGKRMKKYRLYHLSNGQPKLYNSLKKYGWENHTVEILHQCSKSDLNNLEKMYIDKYNTFNSEMGLNLRGGGDYGGKLSIESRNKISKKLIGTQDGEKNNFFGRKHSIEALLKMRTPRSEETKIKFKQSWPKRRERWLREGKPIIKKSNKPIDPNTAHKARAKAINRKEGKSSIYLGVKGCRDTSKIVDGKRVYRKWVAQIRYNKTRKWLGTFNSETDAAIAYNEAAKIYHGEFANLNTI